MITLSNVALGRGTKALYDRVNLQAFPGQRIGLVGPNGAGKSSFFSMLLGEIPPDQGDVLVPQHDRIAVVRQDAELDHTSALDFVLSGHAPLMKARAEVARLEHSQDLMALAQAQANLAELHEGALKAQAHELLAGLGFKPEDAMRPIEAFSGGWQHRLHLARALMCPSELMLLDEPTNHLDIDSVIWLENWLLNTTCTLLIISHDRAFLDRVVTSIWSIEQGTIVRYSGQYSDFERQQAERFEQHASQVRQWEAKRAHLNAFIERFRAKATKARQAQSRIKMLEKLGTLEPLRAQRSWRFEFEVPSQCPEQLFHCEDWCLGYDDKEVLHNVNFEIRAGDRLALLGVNGAGKSTFVKALVGELSPQSGHSRRGQGLVIGYFAQHQLDQLDPEDSALDHLGRLAPDEPPQTLRDFLGRFKFSDDMVLLPVRHFSGGEKARLALALLVWQKPNLLVLDEPTNHLDIDTREALTMALSTFEGALVMVSHDRHLLGAVCEQLYLVHDRQIMAFDGDLDDYERYVITMRKEEQKARQQAQRERDDGVIVNKKELRRQEAALQTRLQVLRKPYVKKIQQLEKQMAPVQTRLQELEAKLASPTFYSEASNDEQMAVAREHQDLKAQLDTLELEWLEAQEAMEAITLDTI